MRGKQIDMIPVGRKGRDFFKRRKMTFTEEYIGLTGKGRSNYADAMEIAHKVIKTFTEDTTIDKVFLVFTEFKTVLSQKPVIEQLLPIPRHRREDETRWRGEAEYIYEQPAAEIFGKLLAETGRNPDLRAMLESVASEQGSRMTAMDSRLEKRGRTDRFADSEYEPHSPGGDHQGNHRSGFRCGGS